MEVKNFNMGQFNETFDQPAEDILESWLHAKADP